MPSDRFWAEYYDLSPTDFLDTVKQFIAEKFIGAEIRREACEKVIEALYSLLPQEEEEKPRLLPMAAFLQEIGEPPPALVAEILPANKLICMSGAAKEGKSLVALEMLENIATGAPLFDVHDVGISGSVAYFGLEDGGFEIKERLTARGILDLPNYYVCWQSFDMNTPAGWQQFLSLVEPIPDLQMVVIDTAREAFRGVRDWNDAALVGPTISILRRWAQKHCTVILITHNNKDKFATGVNKISGSGALVSSCDGFMILEGQTILDNGDLQWNLEMGGRSVKRSKRMLTMDTNTLKVRELEGEEIERAKSIAQNANKTESKQKILIAVRNMPSFTVREVSEECGLSYDYVSKLLKELFIEGKISRGQKVKREGSDRPVQSYVFKEDCTGSNNYSATVPDSEKIIIPFDAQKRVDDFMAEEDSDDAYTA